MWNKLLLKVKEFVGETLLADDDIILVFIRLTKASLKGIRCWSESFS